MKIETRIVLETDHEKILVIEMLEKYDSRIKELGMCKESDWVAFKDTVLSMIKEHDDDIILDNDNDRNMFSTIIRDTKEYEKKHGFGTNAIGDVGGRNYIYKQLEAASSLMRSFGVNKEINSQSRETIKIYEKALLDIGYSGNGKDSLEWIAVSTIRENNPDLMPGKPEKMEV